MFDVLLVLCRRGKPPLLRVVSGSVSPRVSEHGDAERQLVLQRLQGWEETSLQGHPVGEGWPLQVSDKHQKRCFFKNLFIFIFTRVVLRASM